MGEAVRIEIGGEQVELLPERAAWWAAARTLIVADLHLGKEQAFASLGIGVPGTVLDETLDRLARCVEMNGAERVLVVGDLLHARLGTTPEIVERVAAWRRGIGTAIEVVPGNHDRELVRVAEVWGLGLHEVELREGPFRFVHEPDGGGEGCFSWAGHLHPGVVLSAGRDALRLPCFRVGERQAVLPAFSQFTGRVSSQTQPGDMLYAVTPDRVFPVPAPSPARR